MIKSAETLSTFFDVPLRARQLRSEVARYFSGVEARLHDNSVDPISPSDTTHREHLLLRMYSALAGEYSTTQFFQKLKDIDTNVSAQGELFYPLARYYHAETKNRARDPEADAMVKLQIVAAAKNAAKESFEIVNIEQIVKHHRFICVDVNVFDTSVRVFFDASIPDSGQNLAYIHLVLGRLLKGRKNVVDIESGVPMVLNIILLPSNAKMPHLYGAFLMNQNGEQRKSIFVHHASVHHYAHEIDHGINVMLNGGVCAETTVEEGLAVDEGEFDGIPLHQAVLNSRNSGTLIQCCNSYFTVVNQTGFPVGFTTESLGAPRKIDTFRLPYVHGKILVDFWREVFGSDTLLQLHHAYTQYLYSIQQLSAPDNEMFGPREHCFRQFLEQNVHLRTLASGEVVTVDRVATRFNQYIRRYYSNRLK